MTWFGLRFVDMTLIARATWWSLNGVCCLECGFGVVQYLYGPDS